MPASVAPVAMVEIITVHHLRVGMQDLAVRHRLKVKAVRVVEALLREVPREGVAIPHPRLEISVPLIVWIIAPLNIVPCEMNTEPCKIKYVPKWDCRLMEAGVALRVVVAAVNPNKVAVVVPGAKNNTKYQASTIVDSAGFFYLQCL